MTHEFVKTIKDLQRLKLLIIVFAVWQYVSIAGIAILGWPNSLIWLTTGMLVAFIVLCPLYESLLLLIVSIPFFVVLPNTHFDAFPMWRILFAVFFLVWVIRENKFHFKNIIFLPWDIYLAWFVGIGLFLGIVVGPFKIEAIKQVIFLLNIYCFYLVLVNTLKSKRQIFELIRYAIWSLTIIITLGFTQMIGTFLTTQDTFWVYWDTNITQLYYGSHFAQVALYSNSWFSYSGNVRELRMFSIMPDSQSFAYICFIGLCMGTALTKTAFVNIKKWLWSGIRCAGLALILSGTRAVWVGMMLPFAAITWAHYKNFHNHLTKKFFWPFIIIFILFALSPFINDGLGYLQVQKFHENFLSRAESIYNLKETSNQGRIAIWKSSLKYSLTHPLGVGFGNFLVSFNPNARSGTYAQTAEIINTRYNLPTKYISAHSLYLQVLVETGIIGLAVFIGFWVCIIRYLWRFIKYTEKKEDYLVYFVAQALLMVLWVLAAAVFDITLFNDKVLMYFLINLGLSGLIVKNYHEIVEES